MTGKESPAIHHGQKLSILFARASSIAQALPGAANSADAGWEGLPGCADEPNVPSFDSRDGDSKGDENESKYRAMKKSSFKAHTTKRTVYEAKLAIL